MHVSADQDGEFTRQGRDLVVTARVTVRMTDAERWQLDGVRYEACPWVRFRLKVTRASGKRTGHAWAYEVHDCGHTGKAVIVRSGKRPTWDAALQDGQFALSAARFDALDEDQPGPPEPP